MSNVVEYRKFICVNFEDSNNNKVWNIKLYDNDNVEVEWGRVGKSFQSKIHFGGGRHKFDSLIKKKTNPSNSPDKLYSENKVVEGISSSPKNHNLAEIATEQIKTKSKIVRDLVEYLTEVNAHNILIATGGNIVFDVSTAQFKTPQGIIIPEQVQMARQLLADMSDFVRQQEWQDTTFRKKLNEYLRLIPHDVGMKRIEPRKILPSMDILQRENDILDGLETSFTVVTTQPKSDKEEIVIPKLFDVEMDCVDDGIEVDRINRYYQKTRRRMHTSNKFRLKQVYKVRIANVTSAFEKRGKAVGNIMELFHGTKCSNCLSILKQGLVIPPANAAHCTGRLYGSGVYASDISTKALNYATNFWNGGGNTSRTFMFLVDFAMGKIYYPNCGYGSRFPVKGFDSTFAKAGSGGVYNNEMIVYNTFQVNLKYLLEFE